MARPYSTPSAHSRNSSFSSSGTQSIEKSLSAAQTASQPPVVTPDQLNALSSTIINYIQSNKVDIAGLNSPATKSMITFLVKDTLGNKASDNVSLAAGLKDVCAVLDKLPDFQPDTTELFHALNIIYSDNGSTPQSPNKKLTVAHAIVSSYSADWVKPNESLLETPDDLIKKHGTLKKRHDAAIVQRDNCKNPNEFTLKETINAPAYQVLRDELTLQNTDKKLTLNKVMIKPVVDLIDQLNAHGMALDNALHHENYPRFKELFAKLYNVKKNRLQETINTTSTEINGIKSKLGLQASESIDQLDDERLKNLATEKRAPFRDAKNSLMSLALNPFTPDIG